MTDTTHESHIISAPADRDVEATLQSLDGVQSVEIGRVAEQPIGIDIYQFEVRVEVDSGTDFETAIEDRQYLEIVTNRRKLAPELA